jgi:hypothetical protein
MPAVQGETPHDERGDDGHGSQHDTQPARRPAGRAEHPADQVRVPTAHATQPRSPATAL